MSITLETACWYSDTCPHCGRPYHQNTFVRPRRNTLIAGAKNARSVSRTASLKISEWKRSVPSAPASAGLPWSPSATWRDTASSAFPASSSERIQ